MSPDSADLDGADGMALDQDESYVSEHEQGGEGEDTASTSINRNHSGLGSHRADSLSGSGAAGRSNQKISKVRSCYCTERRS